jgi:hypothetical protein
MLTFLGFFCELDVPNERQRDEGAGMSMLSGRWAGGGRREQECERVLPPVVPVWLGPMPLIQGPLSDASAILPVEAKGPFLCGANQMR